MKTTAEDLVDLFRTNVRFVVPRFQRPYVWTKENWEALWDDVIGAVERVDATTNMPSHFLGAVVLDDQRSTGSSTTVVRQVIDGQQRLATLQLLLAAARDVAIECGLPGRYSTSLRKLTDNEDEMSVDPDDVFKVWPTNTDRMPFRHTMSAGSASALTARYRTEQPTIVKAYVFFVEQLRAWAGMFSGADLSVAFERLVTVFNSGMYVVVIKLDPNDNPQVIFESLNSRGLPLQASDLVRNHLFYAAERRGLPAEKLYDEHWARFDDGLWRDEFTQGSLKRPRMDAFLSDFLTMELRKDVPSQQLFVLFRDYLEQSPLPLPEVMARFAAYGDIFHSLNTGTGLDAYEQAFVARLDILNTTVVMPVLLKIFGDYDSDVRRAVLEALNSYLLRRMVMGLPTKSYNGVVLGLLRKLDGASANPGKVSVDYLAGQTVQSNFWPSDQDIARAATSFAVYTQMAKNRLKLVLNLIDDHLRTTMTEYVVRDLDKLTLEHLMPQSWQEHWPLTSTNEAGRQRVLHTLGNLTLTTQALNQSLGNGPWPTKRRALLDNSALNLNRSLPQIWDEAAIHTRGRGFADVLCTALPRPPASGNTAEKPEPEPVELQGDAIDVELETPAEPRRRGTIARHVLDVLKGQPTGAVLTVSQLARASSEEYPQANANPAAIRDRLKKGTVSGVEATTNQLGYLAARLAERSAHADRMPEATAILRAPAGRTELTALEASLHFEMVRLYTRARDEENYHANSFLPLVREQGGLRAAKQLLSGTKVSDGFRNLADRGRLDLTVESLVVKDEFSPLFADEEKAKARERLAQFER